MLRKYKIVIVIALIILMFIAVKISFFRRQHENATETPSVLVKIATVKQMPMANTLMTYGVINVAPGNIQQITIQNEALVQQIFVTQGQRVRIGDPLLLLSTTANSKLNLENAQIAVDFAEKELNRVEALRAQYLATNAEVQTAKQNLAKAQAELNALTQQQKKETGDILRSICNCNILSINAQPGQVAAAATTLLTYANTEKIQIRLGVEYEDINKIHIGQKVIITPIYNSTQSYTGFISNLTDQMDPKTGLIDVIVPLGNVTGLIPGSMVEGNIFLEPEKEMLVVPRSAVLYENNKPYIYIDINDKAIKCWVTVGPDNGTYIAIKNGINANDIVIISGNYELKNGMPIRVEPQS